MLKRLGLIFFGVMFFVLLSPLALYWWGLSNLENMPQPTQLTLTSEEELRIWNQGKELGSPRVRKITVYAYIGYLYCNANSGLYSHKCMNKYPGLSVSALAVRNQVAEHVRDQGNITWPLTWAACTIWVTNNWNIHQILATYNEAKNT